MFFVHLNNCNIPFRQLSQTRTIACLPHEIALAWYCKPALVDEKRKLLEARSFPMDLLRLECRRYHRLDHLPVEKLALSCYGLS